MDGISEVKVIMILGQVTTLILKVIYLKEFIANQTEIATLPVEISKLKELVYLDIWGTNIASFPAEIQGLSETLKEIDMREDHYGYEAEVIIKAAQKGFKILNVPITYKKRIEGFRKKPCA